MNRPSVDPAFTFGLSLAISVVLWFPTLRETMAGNIEITDAGIRYFIALAISWGGVYGVSALVALYATKPRTTLSPSLPPKPTDPATAPMPARRQEDTIAVDAPAPEAVADSNAA